MRIRRRRRHVSLGTVILLILVLAALLVSCVAGSNPLWIKSLFGTDLAVYDAEEVICSADTDSSLSVTLCNSVRVLSSDSVELPTFSTRKEAVRAYREQLLYSLLRDHYTSYVGNSALSNAVSEAYPNLNVMQVIPEEDFENAVFRYFGGASVSNCDAGIFSYLSRASCYTTSVRATDSHLTVTPISIDETEHTCRFTFSLSDSEGNSASYEALFIKRTDSDPYLRRLISL